MRSVCWGKAQRPLAKPPTKEEREGLGREGGKIKFVDVRVERRQIVEKMEGRSR